MTMPFLLALSVLLTFACRTSSPAGSDVKLVDGRIVEPGIGFGAIVLLEINGSPCTGQHIGEGYILTAAHCVIIGGEGEEPTITIFDENGATMMTLDPDQYIEKRPRTDETTDLMAGGESYSIPVPDLSIIRPSMSRDRRKLIELGNFSLSTQALSRNQPDIFVAGYGLSSYEAYDVDGKLRMGRGAISDVFDDYYVTFWRKVNNSARGAGGASGDSGGPLFSKAGANLFIHGVASNILRDVSDDGETIKVWTQYTRLDYEKAQSFITETTGINYIDDSQSQDPIDDEPEDTDLDPTEDQIVGEFMCVSAQSSTPYWTIELDFNDDEYLKIKESRYQSYTTEERPVVVESTTSDLVDYGAVLGIDDGTFAFNYRDDPKTLQKYNTRGVAQLELTCEPL